jgi:amino acid transporter
MISVLGTVNGLILSGSRVCASLGADHMLFAWLGRWSARRGAPFGALLTQSAISLTMIAVVGTQMGWSFVNRILTSVGLTKLQWEEHGGFETLLKCTSPVFWLFFLLTGFSVFILRERDGLESRSFRVPFYPYLPLIFCATCAYMLSSALSYAGTFGLVGGGLLLLGLPLYEVSRRWQGRPKPP